MFHEHWLSQALVELADALVDDFDVDDFTTVMTQRCVELLAVTDGGLMLLDPLGDLRVVASSSEQMRTLELLELQSSEGPGVDAFRTGDAVGAEDLDAIGRSWPEFGAYVRDAGYRSIYAVPMRLRSNVIGALDLFNIEQAPWNADDLELAQALAGVATIWLLHHRAIHDSLLLSTQLHTALNSRVTIEQAKGRLAERLDITLEEAFERLRKYSRSHNLVLDNVAKDLVASALPGTAMDELRMPRNH